MKIKDKMQEMINKQINNELDSSYLYLSMAAYFESVNLRGFSHWMKLQAAEEKEHAMKFFNYLFERDGNVELLALEKPKNKWTSALEAFDDAYKHELKVTVLIGNMMDAALAEKDHATVSFLKWFVDEQVEEEANALEIVEKLKLIKENTGGLMILDRELGSRK